MAHEDPVGLKHGPSLLTLLSICLFGRLHSKLCDVIEILSTLKFRLRIEVAVGGVVRGTWLAAGQVIPLRSRDDQTLHLSLLQDEPRDHPPGGFAVHPLPAITAQRRGSPSRARHRDQPRNGAVLVEQVRAISFLRGYIIRRTFNALRDQLP